MTGDGYHTHGRRAVIEPRTESGAESHDQFEVELLSFPATHLLKLPLATRFTLEVPGIPVEVSCITARRAAADPATTSEVRTTGSIFLDGQELFVRDARGGADPNHSLNVRVITENAWHNLFAYNMFLRPTTEELTTFQPGFTVLHAPGMQADPDKHGTNSGAFIVVNFEERQVLIGGSHYAGEIKKSPLRSVKIAAFQSVKIAAPRLHLGLPLQLSDHFNRHFKTIKPT